MQKTIKILLLGIILAALNACSGFFDKDNTPTPSPLVNFSPEAKIATRYYTKPTNGVGKEYLKLAAAVNHDTVFTADKTGKITASDKFTGKTRWQVNLRTNISAGPAADDNIVIVGTHDGDVIALNVTNGTQHFKAKASSEILAKPAVAHDVVLIKAINGKLSAYSSLNGQLLWVYEQTEPSLI